MAINNLSLTVKWYAYQSDTSKTLLGTAYYNVSGQSDTITKDTKGSYNTILYIGKDCILNNALPYIRGEVTVSAPGYISASDNKSQQIQPATQQISDISLSGNLQIGGSITSTFSVGTDEIYPGSDSAVYKP